MFWRKQRAAMEAFHPLHQALIHERAFSVTMPPAEWRRLLDSLAAQRETVRRRKWQPHERAHIVLVPLLRVLLADMRPGGQLGVTADLRGPNLPEKRSQSHKYQGRRPVRSVTEWYTFDPWLRLRAELRDGSVLDIAVAERTRHRKIHKVNARGKHKWKTKTKAVHRVSVVRRLPRNAAPQRPATPPPPWLAVRVKDGERMVIKAGAKIAVGPRFREQDLPDHILTVAAEPFRWTARPTRSAP
ncbi:hypothetical protein [Actinomadura hibisca]|uniref:hypothetical protein n=1 Tax=Actinomadura hibisca TaxID=68565 RepID=UPI000AF12F73|nr:hypothetical protein [Actinomadura hibisca]